MHARLNQATPTVADSGSLLMCAELDSVFRHLSMDADENTGEVEAPTGHVSKITLSVAGLIAAREHGHPDYHEDIKLVAPGHYIVMVNNSGIVWAFAYDTREARDQAYAEADAQYAEWLGPEITDLDDTPDCTCGEDHA